MTIKDRYDVIVVGAGPAGAAFVRQLLNRDFNPSVLLIERHLFPRDKVCGDAISINTLGVLHKIFPESKDFFPTQALSNLITVWFPNGTRIPLAESSVDVVPRLDFDHFLWKSLKGTPVDVLENAKVTDFVSDPSGQSTITVQVGKSLRQINATLVLGADGSNSVIRKKTGTVKKDLYVVPVRQYVKGVPKHDDGLVIIMDSQNRGYFWIFPFERNGLLWANVGYGTRRTNPRKRFLEYCQSPLVRNYLGDGTFEGEIVGARLNMAATRLNRLVPHRAVAGKGYILLGDAACLGHPHTGEGISAALFSGGLAADLLADGFSGDQLIQAYQTRVFRFIQSAYDMASSSMLYSLPCLLPRFMSGPYVKLLGWQYRRRNDQ